MERDNSWPATVPSVVPSLRYSLSEKVTKNTQNGATVLPIANLMAFEVPSNHASISLSFGDIRM